MKRFQITCRCTQYDFPHRLGGGACLGASWCQYVYENNVLDLCGRCNCNVDGKCEVSSGAESLACCETYDMLIHTQQHTSYPEALTDCFAEMENDYYEEH